jgi:hypothetical protein
MSYLRDSFEMQGGRHLRHVIMDRDKIPLLHCTTSKYRTNSRHVLEPYWTPRTIVFVFHKEAVNQFPRLIFFGEVFSREEAIYKLQIMF